MLPTFQSADIASRGESGDHTDAQACKGSNLALKPNGDIAKKSTRGVSMTPQK